MPSSRRIAVALALLMIASIPGLAAAANWEPAPGDWATFRRDNAHAGSAPGKGAFTTNPNDLRVKWIRNSDLPFWLPPTVADMDGDGVAEVIAVKGNVEVTAPPAPNIEFTSGFEVLDGKTGALRWQYGPVAGNLQWFAPAIGDINGDGKAEMLFMDGQPLTGNFNTNKIFAYTAGGTKLWEYSDVNWGAKVPEGIASLAIADVDGESGRKEVVANVLLATVTTTVSPQGIVQVQGSDPAFEVIALNGEGNVARSWRIPHAHGSVSSPAVADLNGDGTGDVVFGSGMQSGTLIDIGGAVVTLTQDFEDHAIEAWAGGAAPTKLWSFDTSPIDAGDIGTAPSIVDLNGDGKPDVVVPLTHRTGTSVSNITAIANNGSLLWKRNLNTAVARPLAIGDVNGDGKPDVVASTEFGFDGYRIEAFRGSDGALLWQSGPQAAYLNGLPAIADLNGDGKPEVLTVQGATATTPTKLLAFNGQNGALLWSKDVDADNTLGGPVIADIDGDDDGRPEILVNVGSFADSPSLRHSALVAYEPELPDLRITALTFSASTHNLGDAETITVGVTNAGSRTASNAVVEVRDGGALVGSQSVTLSAGASTSLSVPWTPANSGARTVRATADPGKLIPEWVETDNALDRNVQVRSADLAFNAGDPGFSEANPGEGVTITVNATLRNLGDRDANGVVVRFAQDGAAFSSQTVNVAAGATRALSASMVAGTEGPHDIEVLADPDGAIPESNEANNRAARTLPVRFIGPDLTFTAGDPTFSDSRPSPDDTITVGATVRNAGERDAPASVARFLDDGAVFAAFDVPALAPGASQALSAPLLIVGERVHRIKAVADPDDMVREQGGDNNAFTALLQVQFQGPDLALAAGDISFSDPAPGAGDTIDARATVRNVGNRSSVAATVRFLDDGAVFGEATLGALASGASGQVSVPLLAEGVRDHVVRVEVDPADLLQEEDEANNDASTVLPVRFLAPDLTLGAGDIAFGDPNPDEFDLLAVTATVHNGGSPGRTARDVDVQLLDRGLVVATARIASLASGDAASVALHYVIDTVGKRTLTVRVDPANATWELDEANNEARRDVVVGKVLPAISMAKDAFGLQEQASGTVHLAFRNTGQPLARHEFTIPVEYVARAAPSGPSLVEVVAATIAQFNADTSDHLRVCAAGTCADTTVGQAIDVARTLGGGAGAGPDGGEVRFRVATIEARTNLLGDASFAVPMTAVGMLQAAEGDLDAQMCLTGLDALLALAGVEPCQGQAAPIPRLPDAANAPGDYRATARVDWFGFIFAASAEFRHAP